MSSEANADFADKKKNAAQQLASEHYRAEDGLSHVYRIVTPELESTPGEPIKLLEVNVNTVPSGILPVSFGAAPASGIPFSSVIVEVSPEEFTQIQRRELPLPNEWELGEELPKPPAIRGDE